VWTERGRGRAQRNSALVADAEARLGLDVEPAVQTAIVRLPRLVDALNAGYAAGNVAFSVGWLYRLYRAGDPHYRTERRVMVAAFTAALPAFLAFPTAPPRTRQGFVDTLAARGLDLEQPWLVRFYNPVAAMPSLHATFAVVTGAGIAARARGRRGRLAARAYAPLVSFVVVATGNHYVLDVVAGAALGAVVRRVVR
jgi:membrane-associated phospholipid phosphatase